MSPLLLEDYNFWERRDCSLPGSLFAESRSGNDTSWMGQTLCFTSFFVRNFQFEYFLDLRLHLKSKIALVVVVATSQLDSEVQIPIEFDGSGKVHIP